MNNHILFFLLAVFFAVQIAVPACYYLHPQQDPLDERFAWRMYSDVRVYTCSFRANWVDHTTNGLKVREIQLNKHFAFKWTVLAKRGRKDVMQAMAAHLCGKEDSKNSQAGTDLRFIATCKTVCVYIYVCIKWLLGFLLLLPHTRSQSYPPPSTTLSTQCSSVNYLILSILDKRPDDICDRSEAKHVLSSSKSIVEACHRRKDSLEGDLIRFRTQLFVSLFYFFSGLDVCDGISNASSYVANTYSYHVEPGISYCLNHFHFGPKVV